MKRKMVNGEEYDAYTSWRRVSGPMQRPGAVKAVKKRTHRRERREARAQAREADRDF